MTPREQLAQEESRRLDLQRRIAEMDYLSIKHADGCDMSEYDDKTLHPEYNGNWLATKMGLRHQINACDIKIEELRLAIEAEEAEDMKPMEEE